MTGEDEQLITGTEGPGPLHEEDEGELPRAPEAAGGTSTTVKAIAVVIAVLVIGVVVWQVWFSAPDRSDWAYEMTQLNEANDAGYYGQGITVGVVDTGVNADHRVLRDADIVAWRDFVNGRQDPYDDGGHGTAMISLIAARTAIEGGATRVKLIVAKVLDSEGSSTDGRVAKGIWFCIDPNGDGDYRDGADVISLSLGGRTSYLNLLFGTESQAAINEAADSGILVVAAAGNDGEADDGDVANPGRLRHVICVGAVDESGDLASFSSRGRNPPIISQDPNRKPEVVAPGVDLVTAHYEGRYAIGSGTSQATAMVAACLAVVLSALPLLAHAGALGGNLATVVTVKEAVMDSARPLAGADTPHDDRAGYGLVQVMDLIEELS